MSHDHQAWLHDRLHKAVPVPKSQHGRRRGEGVDEQFGSSQFVYNLNWLSIIQNI